MNYFTEDFTEVNYRMLLKKIKNQTIFYKDIKQNNSFSLWRHDVDFSVYRAYALAKIENEENIKGTYFFMLGSMFYNIFEEEIKNKLSKIKSLGHEIALHFDPTQYDIKNKSNLEKYLLFEKEILENLFNVEIKVFSFHNPTEEILKYDDFTYANMINTYAKYFKRNVAYCSDSNGYWRHKRLEEFLKEKHDKIQVLTHPAWWQKDVVYPRQRIQRCIDGRARFVSNNYDSLLNEHKRENIGK